MLVLALAAPASAITRKQAANKAVAALGAAKATTPLIVFGLENPVGAGTRVTTKPGVTTPSQAVFTVGGAGAYLFYEDRAPFHNLSRHPGRVVLVGAKSGKARVSKTILRPPLVAGKLPVFLRNSKWYTASKYRVFTKHLGTLGDPFGTGTRISQGLGNQPPKADPRHATVKLNTPRLIRLTGSDGDGDLITFEIRTPPDHGTLSGQAPDVVYTPDPGYLGADSFHFRTDDGDAVGNDAKVSIDVVPPGSPPVATASTGCTAYTEQGPAVVVDNALAVSDPDDTELEGARVRVANYENGDDLLFTDQDGITGSYDSSSETADGTPGGRGVLTLTGTASVASYQAALRSVRYRNLSNPNPSALKSIEFTASDAGNDSLPATKQVCISEGGTADNNRPVGDTSEGGLDYIENDGPVPVDAGFDVADPDSANLSGATVKFAVSQPPLDDAGNPIGAPVFNFFPAEDELAFTDQNGITGSYDDVNGILTLSGTSSVANYEAALRSVTYENTSENPTPDTRTMQFQVIDSDGATSVPRSRGISVTPVNDAPVVTTSDGSTAYTEQDPGTAVDAGVTVGDVDDTQIEGGSVRIASGFEAGDDLVYVDQLGISGVYNTGTGVLTLTGTASVADYETALRSIEFRGQSDDPPATKTVEFVVNDGDLDSVAATKDIAVTPVNDKPVLTASAGSVAYTENDAPTAVDPGIGASDVDSDTFQGATVQITGNYSGEDVLGFEDQNGITGTFDSETGTLILSGTASVADYETALRSVSYQNTSDNPSTATRTLTFQVDDGGATDNLSDPVTRDIGVTPVNDAPVVTTSDGNSTYTIGDSSGVEVDSALSASDADDTNLESAQVRIASGFEAGDDLVYVDQLNISGVYNTATGVLTLTGTAPVSDYETALHSIKFRTTAESPSASRTVELTVNDGDADSAVASKAIDLVSPPTNEAPVVTTSAGPTAYTAGDPAVAIDSALTVTDDGANLESARVRITDYDASTDSLSFEDTPSITGGFDSDNGILTLNGTASVADYEAALRTVKFSSTATVSGTRSVEFTANDGSLDSAGATKSIVVTSNF